MEPPIEPCSSSGSRSNNLRSTLSSQNSAVDTEPSSDYHIMSTNEEASRCKLDAIKLGYWKDSFLPYFVHASMSHERKTPDILKGYFARVKCIERLGMDFIETVRENGGKSVQIVNLGAGYDTLYWRLKSEERFKDLRIKVVDLDLLPVTTKKSQSIRTHPVLKSLLKGDIREGEIAHGELHSDDYDLVSADIRNTKEIAEKLLNFCKLDARIPTLFITECVLIYMSSDACQQLLTWIAATFQSAGFINYEQVRMDDNFGQIMYNSLKEQGTILADADSCKTLRMHEERFLKAGFTAAFAADMNWMCASLPQLEIERIERLGMIDEPEVLQQLLDHYCIVWAFKNSPDMDFSAIRLL